MNINEIMQALGEAKATPQYIQGPGYLALPLGSDATLDLFLPQYRAHPLQFGSIHAVTDHYLYKMLMGSLVLHRILPGDSGQDSANYSLLVQDAETVKGVSPLIVASAQMDETDEYELLAGDIHKVEPVGMVLRLSLRMAKVGSPAAVIGHQSLVPPAPEPDPDTARTYMYAALKELSPKSYAVLNEVLR